MRMKVLAFLFDLYGRARRRDFWLFTAGLGAAYLYVLNGLYVAKGLGEARREDNLAALNALLHNEITCIALTLVHIVVLVTWVRRLHDRNKSGLWLLLAAVPVIGQAWLIWELGFRPGEAGYNRFGSPPRAQTRSL